jgi:hypothetical protein
MKMLFAVPLAVALLSRTAGAAPPAAGLPAAVETKTQAAFQDIAKAKAALDSGKPKTSEGWLSKAEGLLKSALNAAPGAEGLLGKMGQSTPAQSDSGQQSPSALSRAEGEAAKLDPSVASRLGVSGPGAQATADAGTNAAASAPSGSAGSVPATKNALSGLVDVYQKVVLARQLLQSGDNSRAKSLLDQIPASPLDVLKTAGGL